MTDFETRRDALVAAALRLHDRSHKLHTDRFTLSETLDQFIRACERYREITACVARCDTPQENCTDDHP